MLYPGNNPKSFVAFLKDRHESGRNKKLLPLRRASPSLTWNSSSGHALEKRIYFFSSK
jgi:hypothetical protein